MQKINGFIGLAVRAGQITLGAEMALKEIKSGRAGLVLLDKGASEGTKKKFRDACAFRDLPLYEVEEDLLSSASGRDGRMAGAVRPGKLCQQMLKMLQDTDTQQIKAVCGGASVE